MAGYDRRKGMSHNAVQAYREGRRPLSALRKSDLVAAGLDLSVAFTRWLAHRGQWQTGEWHHASGWYRKVDFYDPETLAHYWNDLSEQARTHLMRSYREWHGQRRRERMQGIRVAGEYTVWGGTRRNPVRTASRTFTGTLRGGWITTDAGERKRADGNHIDYRKIENDPPKPPP